MCDPINEELSPIIEPFTQKMVEEYLERRRSFDKFPLRHYSQLEMDFGNARVRELLERLGIPPKEIVVTIIGGFTGQFAQCLRDIGSTMIFTDPLKEWVENAAKLGFESYRYSAENIPKEILKRTNLFATFECYPPFISERISIYTVLRFLTTKYGILFAESKRTRDELKKEGGTAMLKSTFFPYWKIYQIKRVRREKGDLRFNHLFATSYIEEIKTDCRILKLVYDTYSSDTHINLRNISSLVEKSQLHEDEVVRSLKRIFNLYHLHIPPALKFVFPKGFLYVFSKRFHFDINSF